MSLAEGGTILSGRDILSNGVPSLARGVILSREGFYESGCHKEGGFMKGGGGAVKGRFHEERVL